MSVSKPTSSLFPRKPLQSIHNRQDLSKRESDDKKLKKKLAIAELYKKDIEQGIRLKAVREGVSDLRSKIVERERLYARRESVQEKRHEEEMAALAKYHEDRMAAQAKRHEERMAKIRTMFQGQNGKVSGSQSSKK